MKERLLLILLWPFAALVMVLLWVLALFTVAVMLLEEALEAFWLWLWR